MGNIYYIDQNREKRNTAGAKAPDDIAELCQKRNYKRFVIEPFPANHSKLYQKVWLLTICTQQWIKLFHLVKDEDIVIFQHPSYGKRIAIRWIKKIRKHKKCTFIVLIHDLESLRGGIAGVVERNSKTNKIGDNQLLKCFDFIICHNERMRQYMFSQGFNASKLVNLEIFDYLSNIRPEKRKKQDVPSICIAGNLAFGKSQYIYKICKNGHNAELKLNLYGINYKKELGTKNMLYHGSFKPEELPRYLSGDFGLVWDGDSAETCSGNTGNYLRYNNPHKTSLYLSAGIPVVVWSQAAMAAFVKENNVGIVVDSLDDLEKNILDITAEQYEKMVTNAIGVSKKLQQGYYFYQALDKCLTNVNSTVKTE